MSESTSDKLFAKLRISKQNRFGKKNDSNCPTTSEEFQAAKEKVNGINDVVSGHHTSQTSNVIVPDVPCISQTFEEAVRDPVALASLINFLESVDQLPLLKFWMHVEALLSNLPQSAPSSIIADAVNIVSTYITNSVVPISSNLRDSIKDEVQKAQNNGVLDPRSFVEAQNYIGNLLINRYFKEFLRSNFYARYNVEILQSGRFSLEDILRSHRLLCGFIEFLETQEQRKLLEFLIAVDSFVSQLDESTTLNARNGDDVNFQDDAMVIYDRYFSMQATESLGFGDEIRIEIEGNICTMDGIPKKDAFEKPRQIVAETLQKKLIHMFLDSAHFEKILRELEQALDTYHYRSHTSGESRVPNGYFVRDRSSCDSQHRRTLSTNGDESDEESQSQCSVTIQTPKQNSLRKSRLNSLAKVDQLGRYKPLFDTSLCNNSEETALSARSRLKSALDKYLNQSAAKEKLVAEEIAELIISDVRQAVEKGNLERRQNRTKCSAFQK
ncbi:regulator of G protein signaling domain-containing protein [Ditylenchus destructor]|nr:regulator of G protein signaling domain-containing protein [Ditylenchus destructor]